MILAGISATNFPDGISFVTTEPAAMITLLPIVTPPTIITPEATQHPSPILIS